MCVCVKKSRVVNQGAPVNVKGVLFGRKKRKLDWWWMGRGNEISKRKERWLISPF